VEKQINRPKLPQTDSIQELARFWDTHDLSDFEDQLEEVTEPVFERKKVVHIRLEPEEIEVVQEMAKAKGIDSADLIREWILQRIQTA
jgi:predicted DNA binding CopG/RHH family protein